MKIQIDNTDNKCWFWHKWFTDKETVITKYQRCLKCASKRIISDESKGYQPVDTDYISNLERLLK